MDSWHERLGPTFAFHGPLYAYHRLCTTDHRAISHMMADVELYQKPTPMRNMMNRYMKEGLLSIEGFRWRVQRKVVQKFFGKGNLKGMEKVVEEKTDLVGRLILVVKGNGINGVAQLRDLWLDLIADPERPNIMCPYPADPKHANDSRIIDVYGGVSRMMYDIIGRLAMNHSFDCLGDSHGPGGVMLEAYMDMQQFQGEMSETWAMFTAIWPFLEIFKVIRHRLCRP
jgi:hypothetical protein